MSAAPKFKKVDIVNACLELSQLMKESPADVDRELVKKGESLLGIFQDPNYTDKFQNLKEVKREIYDMAINDIAAGVMVLRSSVIGVTFSVSKLKTYVTPHGSLPEGSVVFSISWKNIRAFRNWREGSEDEVTQEQINDALYALAFRLSKLI